MSTINYLSLIIFLFFMLNNNNNNNLVSCSTNKHIIIHLFYTTIWQISRWRSFTNIYLFVVVILCSFELYSYLPQILLQLKRHKKKWKFTLIEACQVPNKELMYFFLRYQSKKIFQRLSWKKNAKFISYLSLSNGIFQWWKKKTNVKDLSCYSVHKNEKKKRSEER
jgi:hypothetical protein